LVPVLACFPSVLAYFPPVLACFSVLAYFSTSASLLCQRPPALDTNNIIKVQNFVKVINNLGY
jgi:hypothetical protein